MNEEGYPVPDGIYIVNGNIEMVVTENVEK